MVARIVKRVVERQRYRYFTYSSSNLLSSDPLFGANLVQLDSLNSDQIALLRLSDVALPNDNYWQWEESLWTVRIDEDTDEDGWQYATSFNFFLDGFKRSPGLFDIVRQRVWERSMVTYKRPKTPVLPQIDKPSLLAAAATAAAAENDPNVADFTKLDALIATLSNPALVTPELLVNLSEKLKGLPMADLVAFAAKKGVRALVEIANSANEKINDLSFVAFRSLLQNPVGIPMLMNIAVSAPKNAALLYYASLLSSNNSHKLRSLVLEVFSVLLMHKNEAINSVSLYKRILDAFVMNFQIIPDYATIITDSNGAGDNHSNDNDNSQAVQDVSKRLVEWLTERGNTVDVESLENYRLFINAITGFQIQVDVAAVISALESHTNSTSIITVKYLNEVNVACRTSSKEWLKTFATLGGIFYLVKIAENNASANDIRLLCFDCFQSFLENDVGLKVLVEIALASEKNYALQSYVLLLNSTNAQLRCLALQVFSVLIVYENEGKKTLYSRTEEALKFFERTELSGNNTDLKSWLVSGLESEEAARMEKLKTAYLLLINALIMGSPNLIDRISLRHQFLFQFHLQDSLNKLKSAILTVATTSGSDSNNNNSNSTFDNSQLKHDIDNFLAAADKDAELLNEYISKNKQSSSYLATLSNVSAVAVASVPVSASAPVPVSVVAEEEKKEEEEPSATIPSSAPLPPPAPGPPPPMTDSTSATTLVKRAKKQFCNWEVIPTDVGHHDSKKKNKDIFDNFELEGINLFSETELKQKFQRNETEITIIVDPNNEKKEKPQPSKVDIQTLIPFQRILQRRINGDLVWNDIDDLLQNGLGKIDSRLTSEDLVNLQALHNKKDANLLKIPRVTQRLQLLNNIFNFDSDTLRINRDTNVISSVCDELTKSENWRKILGLVLYIGNAVNNTTSNSNSQEAKKIKITSLKALQTSKMPNNPSETLLTFISEKIMGIESLGGKKWHKELIKQLPSLDQASKNSFSSIISDWGAMMTAKDNSEKEVDALEKSNPNEDPILVSKVKAFWKASDRVNSIKKTKMLITQTRIKVDDLLAYLCEEADKTASGYLKLEIVLASIFTFISDLQLQTQKIIQKQQDQFKQQQDQLKAETFSKIINRFSRVNQDHDE